MAEYLSPGVFVEEIDSGPRPIEGASTSTAAVVGVAERGPENVPVLLTAGGQYPDLFGGDLDPAIFTDCWYLPYAARGFFQNGGQRLWVVRVVPDGADFATVQLMAQGSPTAFASWLLAQVRGGDQNVVLAAAGGLAGGEILRIDDGGNTEYVTVGAASLGTLATRAVGLWGPAASASLVTAQAQAIKTANWDGTSGLAYDQPLHERAVAGTTRIVVDARPGTGDDPFAPGQLLRIDDLTKAYAEIVEIAAVPADPADNSLRLRDRLAHDHAVGVHVVRLKPPTTSGAPVNLLRGVAPGDALVVVDGAPLATNVVRLLDPAGHASYYPTVAPLAMALRGPVAVARDAGEVAVAFDPATIGAVAGTLTQNVAAGATRLHVSAVAGLAVGDWIRVGPGGPTSEYGQLGAVDTTNNILDVVDPLGLEHATGEDVREQAVTSTVLLEHAVAGATTVLLGGTGFNPGWLTIIGPPGDREVVELGPQQAGAVVPLTGTATASHRAGLAAALRQQLFSLRALDRGGWGNQLRVRVDEEPRSAVETTVTQTVPGPTPLASLTGVEPGTLVELLDFSTQLTAFAREGDTQVHVPVVGVLAAGEWVRIGRTDSETHRLTAVDPGANANDWILTLDAPLSRTHAVNEPLDHLDASGLPQLGKVGAIQGGRVVFDPPLALPATAGMVVRSREFKLTIEWVKTGAANPSVPGAERVVSSETHRGLTLDDRHSRYVGRVIGRIDGPPRLWDRRPEGQSNLVRVDDPAFPNTSQTTLRVGPDTVYEVLPGGRRRSAPRSLAGGDDDIGGVDAALYVGQDNDEPSQRTGTFALNNEDDISIVAVPGRTDVDVANALILNCELDRYRFAVLDAESGPEPEGATIVDVTAQRQQYDTKYAALYWPWLRITHPFPPNPSVPGELSIPPSGHMLGVYARTDVTRGVHKAPANEVVSGILGFQRAVTKGEQDLLNPFPVNINVLRDFRSNFRGLRSWGARVISSDPAWRYVNVRRLFNYVEKSLDLGLQWVVFEPNDQNLWAQAERTISDFLTLVWRSGGLFGSTAEDAFYVKCDISTMSPQDIEAGRFIAEVGICPVRPAEFVVVRVSQWQGGSALEEG